MKDEVTEQLPEYRPENKPAVQLSVAQKISPELAICQKSTGTHHCPPTGSQETPTDTRTRAQAPLAAGNRPIATRTEFPPRKQKPPARCDTGRAEAAGLPQVRANKRRTGLAVRATAPADRTCGRRCRNSRSNASAPPAGSASRPALKSSASCCTVSWAQELLVPMNPVGPRLIQPVTYAPGKTSPSGPVSTRPARFGMIARCSSNGRPGVGTPR